MLGLKLNHVSKRGHRGRESSYYCAVTCWYVDISGHLDGLYPYVLYTTNVIIITHHNSDKYYRDIVAFNYKIIILNKNEKFN